MRSLHLKTLRCLMLVGLLGGRAEAAAPLYSTDFSDAAQIAPLFERHPKMEVRDGVLRVSNAEGHAASPTLMIPFGDGTFGFRFRVVSGEGVTCRFEDRSRVPDANAHLCRLQIQKGKARLLLDQPLQDRELRKATVLAETSGNFADGKWHTAVLRFDGEIFSAVLDGGSTLEGRHPHVAHEKIGTFFVVTKAVVEIDDVKLTGVVAKAGAELVAARTALPAAAAANANPNERGLGLFADYVEPMFKKHCYECHSHGAKKIKGGLVLDSRNGLLKGGEFGPVLVPGKPEESLLLKAIGYTDPDLEMPPKQKLDGTLVAHVREWIALGAPDPRAGPEIGGQTVAAKGSPRVEDLWSLKPLVQTPPPAVKQTAWPRGPVDRYLLAAMEAKGLAPSPDAAPHLILRRLHDVLTGLPPTPEETSAFMAAAGRDLNSALETKIDALLASRQFGVRWARHWLDIARYADVDGGIAPKPMTQSWLYREYVIDAFNRDKPWADFVREQIAGDMLPAAQPEARIAQRIATGFLSLSHVVGVDRKGDKQKLDTMDEQMDVMGKTFLGLQFGCARCHDHKIDPIPTRDYYALAGVFRSTDIVRGAVKKADDDEELEPAPANISVGPGGMPAWLQAGSSAKFGVKNAAKLRNEPIHLRGEEEVLGEVVPRALPTLLQFGTRHAIPPETSGRMELADWLLSEENPLVPRVIVNRVWHHVFGRGIVRSTDNFGLSGEAPSHPDLLDDLARRFRLEHRGSVKSLLRELLLSHAFRQASVRREDAMTIDPENRLLWRAHVRRRDAEALVDSLRFVSGELDLEPAQFTAPAFKSGNQASTSDLEIPAATLNKRAIYWPVFRKDTPVMLDILTLFDFPDATLPRGVRDAQQLPSQALALLNSPMILDAARALNAQLPEADEATRIDAIYRRVLARAPTKREATEALAFFQDFAAQLAATGAAKPENARRIAWNRLCHTFLISSEFIVLQ